MSYSAANYQHYHLFDLLFEPCHTASLAELINAFERVPTDSLWASIAFFFHVSLFLMLERSVIVVAYLHVDHRG